MARAQAAYWSETARLNTAKTSYLVARYQSEIALRQSEVSLFLNQQKMELPIFLLVLAIVLTALYLAHAQLRVWMKRPMSSDGSNATALSISKEGLVLNTPFVGLLMLVGAFGFFYMYIDKVYTIQPRSEALNRQIDQYGNGASPRRADGASSSDKPTEHTGPSTR